MHKGLLRAAATLALSVLPAAAHAQYKNSAFGLDVGAWLITKPTIWNTAEQIPLEGSRVPLRLQNGVRIGGESNFKMDDDHFWFTGRVNVGFLQFPQGEANGTPDERFDAQARDRLGTLLGVEGNIGVRYVFLTDRWLILNAADNNAVVLGVGLLFFS